MSPLRVSVKIGPWTMDWTVDSWRPSPLFLDLLSVHVAIDVACWIETELARSQDGGSSYYLQCVCRLQFNWQLFQEVCKPIYSYLPWNWTDLIWVQLGHDLASYDVVLTPWFVGRLSGRTCYNYQMSEPRFLWIISSAVNSIMIVSSLLPSC